MAIDVETLVAGIAAVAGAIGGHVNGKRIGAGVAVTTARDTVEMLALQVELLNQKNTEKDNAILQLTHRIDTLQELVTQRAAVGEVKDIVERIAAKVSA